MCTFQIHLEIIAQIMRTSLLITFLSFFTFAQATPSPGDLVSSDSLEIQIRQNDSLYKVLRLHRRAEGLNKMIVGDHELTAILVAELVRTQQTKKIILGGLDLSFSEFAAKVAPRSANGSLSAERALIRQNKKIESRLRQANKLRIPSRGRLRRMCEADYLLEWSVCVSPYHAFESNQTTITLTASRTLVDSAIEQMRLETKKNKRTIIIAGAVGGIALAALAAPLLFVLVFVLA